MITSEELEAIEALANAATPGPWTRDFYGRIESPTIHVVRGQGGCKMHVDAEFIAASRQIIPALVEEVRRLRTALEKIAVFDGLTVEGETAAQVLRGDQ